MATALMGCWNCVRNRIKELDLYVLLNGITDRAITSHTKELQRTSQMIQVQFDEQAFRKCEPHLQALQLARVKQLIALLSDLDRFIPENSIKFKQELAELRTLTEKLLLFEGKAPTQRERPSKRSSDAADACAAIAYQSLAPASVKQKQTEKRHKKASGLEKLQGIEREAQSREQQVRQSFKELQVKMDLNGRAAAATISAEAVEQLRNAQSNEDELTHKLRSVTAAAQLRIEQLEAEQEGLRGQIRQQSEQIGRFLGLLDAARAEKQDLMDKVDEMKNEAALQQNEMERLRLQLQKLQDEARLERLQAATAKEEMQRGLDDLVQRGFEKEITQLSGKTRTVLQEFQTFEAELRQMIGFNSFEGLDALLKGMMARVNALVSQREEGLLNEISVQERQMTSLRRSLDTKDGEARYLRESLRKASTRGFFD